MMKLHHKGWVYHVECISYHDAIPPSEFDPGEPAEAEFAVTKITAADPSGADIEDLVINVVEMEQLVIEAIINDGQINQERRE